MLITTEPTRSPAEWALAYLRFAERQLRPSPGFAVGWSIDTLTQFVLERELPMPSFALELIDEERERLRASVVKPLRDCCIGSRAAFAKLLADRNALSDAELKAIIDRLDEVVRNA